MRAPGPGGWRPFGPQTIARPHRCACGCGATTDWPERDGWLWRRRGQGSEALAPACFRARVALTDQTHRRSITAPASCPRGCVAPLRRDHQTPSFGHYTCPICAWGTYVPRVSGPRPLRLEEVFA